MKFSNLTVGTLAHAHHLMAYAGEPVPVDTPDPRNDFVEYGSAKTVRDLSGKWTPDPNYGKNIESIIRKFR
jgi:hypothetical protein